MLITAGSIVCWLIGASQHCETYSPITGNNMRYVETTIAPGTMVYECPMETQPMLSKWPGAVQCPQGGHPSLVPQD